MRTRFATLLPGLVLGAALILGLAACSGPEDVEVRALFDDVVDLTIRGHVKVADVPVGVVRRIELTEDNRALVIMSVDPAVELPSVVRARLRKTNVLGERFVDLVPDRTSGGRYEAGSVITDTEVVPELEALVQSGTQMLAAVTADRIAAAIEAGAVGLGGRGATFDQLLDDLTAIVSTYDRNSDDLVRLLSGLDAFLAEVGPQADLHGRAFEELARTAAVLREEDDRLLDALADVRTLSRTGTDLITTHRERIDRFFDHFSAITTEILRRDADLARLFDDLATHNTNTIRGVNAEHAQVILDFIVCGENDVPGDPVRACETPPQGRPQPEAAPRVNSGGRP
jgi:phospholipid/cholesterol/gamma-HCH transport system substrate-binding protein